MVCFSGVHRIQQYCVKGKVILMLFVRLRNFIIQFALGFTLIAGLNGVAVCENGEQIQVRTISISPYGIDNNNHFSGIYYDLANTLVNESGYPAINYVYPYVRIIHELKFGRIDLTIMFKYKELDEFVIYVAPLPSIKNVVIGLKGSDIDSIEDLRYKKLAYLRGAKFSDAIDSDITIEKVQTVDFSQGVRMLKRGRVNAVIGPLEALLKAAEASDVSPSEFSKPLIVSERTPWVQVSKKSQDRVDVSLLRAHIESILKRGDLEQLRQKYLPEE